MYEEEFSNRLAQLRSTKEISARDMSLSLGQNSGYINHIENNQTLPSMSAFFNICEFFDISPKDFFDTENPEPHMIAEITLKLKKLNREQLQCIFILLRDLSR